jgi:hypothetical protein
MRYLRGRRLTEAARVLAGGTTDILAVAVDAGYGSHEACTRAFREQFGATPEAVRRHGDLGALELVEPIKMEETLRASNPPVRFEHGKVLLITGIAQRYMCETSAAIPSQWQRFMPLIGNIAGQVGATAFGVRCNIDDEEASTICAGSRCPTFECSALNSCTCEFRRSGMRCSHIENTCLRSEVRGSRSGRSGCRNPAMRLLTRPILNAMARSSTPEREMADSRFGFRSEGDRPGAE